MATAGYAVTVSISGTSTPFVDESVNVIDLASVQVVNPAYRNMDPGYPVSVTADGALEAPDAYTVDFFTGTFTWKDGTIPVGEILVSGYFVPLLRVAESRGCDISMSRVELDDSTSGSNGTGENTSILLGRKSAEVSLPTLRLMSGVVDSDSGSDVWETLHSSATPKLLQVEIETGRFWRGWVLFPGLQAELPQDGLVTTTVTAKTSARRASGRSEYVSFSIGE